MAARQDRAERQRAYDGRILQRCVRELDVGIRIKLDLIFLTLGTAYLAPRFANYFSAHKITPMQAFGWGATFFAVKTKAKFDNANHFER